MSGSQRRRAHDGLRGRAVGAILLSVLPIAALSQAFSFGSIVVEGNQRIADSTVLAQAGIAPGETLTAGELNDAAQALRATGLFQSVDLAPRGGTLVITVQEWPFIRRIAFEGNRVVKDDDLAAVVRSVERRVYSPTQAEQDAAAIAQAYVNAGRVNAVVTPAIIPRDDGTVDLVFQIAEGGITEVERISFVGNRAFGEGRLRNVLETRQAGILRAIIGADTYVAERVDFDRQALTDFYRSRGYADATVENVDVNLTAQRDAYLITFNIREGQRFTFGNVTVTSAVPEVDAATFDGLIRVRRGDVYSPTAIENDVSRIEAAALRAGINFLRVEPRITRDERGLALNVEYALVPGDRIFVERIDIEGNATTLDRVIRSQFRTVEGDPFNPREIRESAERIRALGYFADADVNAREGSSPDTVVIDVNVEEQPTGTLSFGGNYSSDSGPSLTLSFSEDNFLGRGQALSADLNVGRDAQLLTFSFREPEFLGRDLEAGLDLSYRRTDNDAALYDTQSFRFSPSLGFPASERGRLSVFYAVEFNDITDVAGADTPLDPSDDPSAIIVAEAAEGGIWTQSLGYSYNFDTRRGNIDTPTNVTLRFAQEFGFGDKQFIQTTALASAETRIFGEEVTLRATAEGGLLSYSEGASRVTDRFFLGARTLRGFERGGVGPRDAATDDALGGNAYAVIRLETEFPLPVPDEYGISAGAFVDYGSVWDVGDLRGLPETDDPEATEGVLYNDFTPRATAGLSLFWTTPLGPLRFNFMKPLIVEERDNPRSFELTVSTRF